MSANPPETAFWQALEVFIEHLGVQVDRRWEIWGRGSESRHVHEVVGGLLARQATLAAQMAANPRIWNPHLAHMILRSMVENCITLAWILKEPEVRAKAFVDFGLGQANLVLEHMKEDLREAGEDPDTNEFVKGMEDWINGERYTFATVVNVGSMAGSLREMATDTGLLGLHRIDYALWSGATHNMWHHIVQHNIRLCPNPLHGYHRLPAVGIPPNSIAGEYLWRAASYVDLALSHFDDATGTEVDIATAIEVLEREFPEEASQPSG